MRRDRHIQRGFTVIELLVAGSLAIMVSGILLEFLVRQTDFSDTVAMESDLRSQVQLATTDMLKELRHATRAAGGSPPNISIPAAPNNTTITFYLPADLDGNGMIIDAAGSLEWAVLNPVQYQYDAPSRQLRRIDNTGTRVIANTVSQVSFEDRTINASLLTDEVRIRLTLQDTTSRGRTLSAADTALVKLRN